MANIFIQIKEKQALQEILLLQNTAACEPTPSKRKCIKKNIKKEPYAAVNTSWQPVFSERSKQSPLSLKKKKKKANN